VFYTWLITSRNVLGFVRLVEKDSEVELSRLLACTTDIYGAGAEPAINLGYTGLGWYFRIRSQGLWDQVRSHKLGSTAVKV
jgi:hypothetical protein